MKSRFNFFPRVVFLIVLAGFFKDVSRDPYLVDEFVKKYCSGD